ncbi:MAG: hypothetical protein KJ749_07440 [Planctomycetes bacterium]|nr:hypothetical protein [Planctomycetota bacterium]
MVGGFLWLGAALVAAIYTKKPFGSRAFIIVMFAIILLVMPCTCLELAKIRVLIAQIEQRGEPEYWLALVHMEYDPRINRDSPQANWLVQEIATVLDSLERKTDGATRQQLADLCSSTWYGAYFDGTHWTVLDVASALDRAIPLRPEPWTFAHVQELAQTVEDAARAQP